MKIKSIINRILIAVFCVSSTLSFCEQPAPQMPPIDISPDQMQKMETMMEGMQNFYEALSPEEKSQFETELTAETEKEMQKLQSMGPDQQKQYIETAFGAFDDIDLDELLEQLQQEEDESPERMEENTDNKTVDKKKETEEQEALKKQKIKDTLDLIENIIKSTDSLIAKLSSVKPSAKDLIEKWINKKYIPKWAGSKSNWDTFKNELEQMVQKLHQLKQSDPVTGKYYYLDNIKNVEKLYGKLDLLYNTIKKYEPNVEISAEGKVKNEAAKSALRRLINYLIDTTKTITQSAQEIIAAFEKDIAPKLKKEEDTKAKKASKHKRKSRPARAKQAGKKEQDDYEPDYGYSPYGDDENYYSPDYGSGDSGSYADYPDYSSSSYGDSSPRSSATPSSAGRTAKSGSGSKDKADSKDKTEDKASTSGKSGKEGKSSKPKVKTDYAKLMEKDHPKLHKNYKRVKSNLENFDDAFDAFKDLPNWKNLNNYLYTLKDQDAPMMQGIAKAQKSYNEAKIKAETFKKELKKTKSSVKKNLEQEVDNLFKNYSDTVKEIKKKQKINKTQVLPERLADYTIIVNLLEQKEKVAPQEANPEVTVTN